MTTSKNNYHVSFTLKGSIIQSFIIKCLPKQIKGVIKDHRRLNEQVKNKRAVITIK